MTGFRAALAGSIKECVRLCKLAGSLVGLPCVQAPGRLVVGHLQPAACHVSLPAAPLLGMPEANLQEVWQLAHAHMQNSQKGRI